MSAVSFQIVPRNHAVRVFLLLGGLARGTELDFFTQSAWDVGIGQSPRRVVVDPSAEFRPSEAARDHTPLYCIAMHTGLHRDEAAKGTQKRGLCERTAKRHEYDMFSLSFKHLLSLKRQLSRQRHSANVSKGCNSIPNLAAKKEEKRRE